MNAFPVTRRSRGLHVRAGVHVVANVGSTWFWGGTEPHVGRGVRPGTRATHCGREQGLSAERREEPKPAPRSRARGPFVPPCSLRRCGRWAARRPSRNPPLLCGGPRGPWAHSRPSPPGVPHGFNLSLPFLFFFKFCACFGQLPILFFFSAIAGS